MYDAPSTDGAFQPMLTREVGQLFGAIVVHLDAVLDGLAEASEGALAGQADLVHVGQCSA